MVRQIANINWGLTNGMSITFSENLNTKLA